VALSISGLLTMLQSEIPSGVQTGTFATVATQAISDAITYAQQRLRERVDAEFWGDGVTTRFPLTGRQVRLLKPDAWATPVSLNTAGIAAPSAAATYTADTGGSLPAGAYLACYAYETPLGVTPPTSPVATTVAASGKITRGALTPPAGATVADYLSVAAGAGELRRVGTGGSGAALALSAVPLAAAPHAQVDFADLSTLAPDVEHTEGGIAADGSTSATVTTLTVANAPDAGARFRVPYTRLPLIPADTSATIGLDDDILRLGARAHMCAALAMNVPSGDATDWAGMAKLFFQQLDNLIAGSSGRRPPRVRYVGWS
jgi:hypothetical protein